MVGGEVRVGGACDADEHEHVCGTSTRTPTSPLLQCCPSTEATAYKTQIKKHEMNADEARKYFLSGGSPKCRGAILDVVVLVIRGTGGSGEGEGWTDR